MAVTKSWDAKLASQLVVEKRPRNHERTLEFFLLAGASLLVACGLAMVFSAKTQDVAPKPAATYDGVFSVCHGKLTKIMQTGDAVGTAQLRAIAGISNLQLVTTGGGKMERFAALITLGPATIPPTVDDGAPGIYVISVPDC